MCVKKKENRVAGTIHAVMRVAYIQYNEIKYIHVKHSSEGSLRLLIRSLNLVRLVYICIENRGAGTLGSMQVLQVEYLHMKEAVDWH